MHYRYVEATYDVLRYIEAGESPDTAAFRAAQANGLSLTEYGRLARETEERYNES